ncbi:MAG: RNA polymerase factor sigma-54 [bacterium]|nr:RNA polymerase factor sigma-54 [bacterium]
MELRQVLKPELQQYLQPQQILRSELIQLPMLELELRVRAELQENPFLEEIAEDEAVVDKSMTEVETEASAASLDDSGESAEYEAAARVARDEPEQPESRNEDEVDWDSFLSDDEHSVYKASRFTESGEELTELPRPFVQSLAEYLEDQMRLQRLDDEEFRVGQYIIGSINRDGFLSYPIEEIARELNVPVAVANHVLVIVQELDPPGIGARDLRECLLIQLRQKDDPQKYRTAKRMLTEAYEDFMNKRFEVVARKLGVVLDEVKNAYEEIRRLNPKPGEGYFDEKQNYVIPDLVVARVDDEGEFAVYLNDGNTPNFHVNTAYKEMFLSGNTDKKVKEFVARKLESARWFINAIHQRRATILRTMRAIVERQKDFFMKGREFLRPMILQDIAEDISMDISTISRVTNGKYVQTEWGVFELKYFFSERMETSDGEEISTKVIKSRLQEIIEAEDKSDPLSDQAIAEMLADEGFPIARRTVQKYREQLSIPVKRLRREI